MIYLAQPFSQYRLQAYDFAKALGYAMLNIKPAVYSPILHWHEVDRENYLGGAYEVYQNHNYKIIMASEMVFGLHLPGWEKSEGLLWEQKISKNLNKPYRSCECDFKSQLRAIAAGIELSWLKLPGEIGKR